MLLRRCKSCMTEIPSLVVMTACAKNPQHGVWGIAVCGGNGFLGDFFGKFWLCVYVLTPPWQRRSYYRIRSRRVGMKNLKDFKSPSRRPGIAHRVFHHDAKGQRTTKPQWDCSRRRRRWHPPFCYHLTVDEYHDERRLQFGWIYSRGMVGTGYRNSWRVGGMFVRDEEW